MDSPKRVDYDETPTTSNPRAVGGPDRSRALAGDPPPMSDSRDGGMNRPAMTPDDARLLAKELVALNPNPARCNRAISAAYASLYLGRGSLRWAGMASFVSNHVGCSIRSRFRGFCTRWFLALGNRLVFEDVYPALRFYHDQLGEGRYHGRIIGELRNYGTVAADIVKGLDHLGSGAAPPDVLARESAEIILYHEQSQVLQIKVFESAGVRVVSHAAALASRLMPGLLTVKFGSSCRQKDPDYQIRAEKGLNLADLNHRWPFALQVAERFHTLVGDPRHAARMQQACQEIANAI
jgi:hypothetical protein